MPLVISGPYRTYPADNYIPSRHQRANNPPGHPIHHHHSQQDSCHRQDHIHRCSGSDRGSYSSHQTCRDLSVKWNCSPVTGFTHLISWNFTWEKSAIKHWLGSTEAANIKNANGSLSEARSNMLWYKFILSYIEVHLIRGTGICTL